MTSKSTLETYEIPSFFAKHPTFQLEPFPHLVLPEPYQDFCLTLYKHEDLPRLRELAIHPAVVPYFGVTGEDDPTLDGVCKWMDDWMSRKAPAFPFQVIRHTKPLQAWKEGEPLPPLLGSIGYGRNGFFDVPRSQRKEMQEAEKNLSVAEGNWQTNMIGLFPEVRGKGLMTTIMRWTLETWYLPAFNPKPAKMATGWESRNLASRKMHERAGYKIAGRRPENPDKPDDKNIEVIALWGGAGDFKKEDTIYKDIPDWEYED